MPAETGSDPETTLNETGLMYTLHFVSDSSQEAKASAKNDGNLLPSCTNQPSGRHCHAVLGALSLQLHPYRKISGRRNCAGPLLPANSRKSHSLSRWGLTQLAMGDRSVCQIEQVLLFFGFDFPGRCERKGEETS